MNTLLSIAAIVATMMLIVATVGISTQKALACGGTGINSQGKITGNPHAGDFDEPPGHNPHDIDDGITNGNPHNAC